MDADIEVFRDYLGQEAKLYKIILNERKAQKPCCHTFKMKTKQSNEEQLAEIVQYLK